MQPVPQCHHCRRLDTKKTVNLIKYYCEAYPKGVPDEIILNNVDHRKPFKGDNGILFLRRKK